MLLWASSSAQAEAPERGGAPVCGLLQAISS